MRRVTPAAILTASLLVAALVGVGVVVSVGSAADSLPRTAASAYVATDGTRGFATFTQAAKNAPAMVENARLVGSATVSAVPGGMFARTVPAPGVDASQAHWWRESVVVGADDGGVTLPSRYRLRTVTTDGVRLHGQSWGRLGMTFEPALLELPADVTAGRHWTSDGRALGDEGEVVTYRNASDAAAAADRADASAGCLDITSTTELQPEGGTATTGSTTRWTETERWCPGLGVVADSGDFRGTAFTLPRTSPGVPATLAAAALEPAVPPAGDLGAWRQGTLQANDGDATFGDHRTTISTDGARSAVAASGTLHVLNDNERDVDILTPLDSGDFWALGWMHPGAPVTSVATIGYLVVLTTTDRRLVAYDFTGRLRWSATLPDVAVVAPLPVSGNRLLVASIGGQVGAYDALTGRRVWRHDVGTALDTAPAAAPDTAVVLDTEGQLHALDLADGHERWDAAAAAAGRPPTVVDDRVLTWSFGRLDALDLATGRRVWERSDVGGVQGVGALDGVAALRLDDETRGCRVSDGAVMWTRAGSARDAIRYGTNDFLLTDDGIVAIDRAGRDVHRWPVEPDLGADPRLLAGGGQVWAVGHDESGLTGVWVGDREPGE